MHKPGHKHGQYETATINESKITKINVSDLLFGLKLCIRKKDMRKGKRIHTNAVEAGIESNIYVAGALINLYAKCGSMVDALTVFDRIQKPNVACWNALIMGYVENGQGLIALDWFSRMKNEGICAPDSLTYVAALQACTLAVNGGGAGKGECLERGRHIHSQIGSHMNHFVQNTLMNLYSKCCSMENARLVFDSIKNPDVVAWNVLILGYVDNGNGLVALDLFSRMKKGCAPDSLTYVASLKACTSLAANGGEGGKRECMQRGREIHSEVGRHMNHFVQNTLINMYAKCGSMVDAMTVFEKIHDPNVVCWNALIQGYAGNGQGLAALDLFYRMKDEGRCAPNSLTYVAALKGCTSLATDGDESSKRGCLEIARKIHLEIGCHLDNFVQSTLINLYAKCGSMIEARKVFHSIQEPDVVCWTALILGYADHGQGLVALDLFSRMKNEGTCSPNHFTYVAALRACTSLAEDGGEAGKQECLQRGKQIHSDIGHQLDHFVENALISMYAKCGSMIDARKVFDSTQEPQAVAWTALILGYAENGQGLDALDLFCRMQDDSRCAPNSLTFLAALKACTSVVADGDDARKRGCLEWGRQLHSEIGCNMDHLVESTLINLYAKCGSMVNASEVFDSILEPDVVSWNALILGYVENGQGLAALELFSKMENEGRCAPNSLTYVAALKACRLIGALAIGRRIHSVIGEFDSQVLTSLVDFYAKCGSIKEALEVFHLHPGARNLSTWNALLAGYARFGDNISVFSLFDAMQRQEFQPNAITFVCVLSCCSHAGLVVKGWEYLEVMPTQYRVTPTVVHYNCMIDLLGRANRLNEAVALLQKMPCDPDAVTWKTLLGACHKWKNLKIGRWAFKCMGQKNAPDYVLMADIYGSRGMWEEQEWVLETTKFGLCEQHAQAYVERW